MQNIFYFNVKKLYALIALSLVVSVSLFSFSAKAEEGVTHVRCNFVEAGEVSTNQADYIVTPSPTQTFMYSKLSDAIADAMIIGDKDLNGSVDICVEAGTSSPNYYYENDFTISLDPWTGVLNGTPNDPLNIFSDGHADMAVFRPTQTSNRILNFSAISSNAYVRPLKISSLTFDNPYNQNLSGGLRFTNIDATITDSRFIDLGWKYYQNSGGAINASSTHIDITNSYFFSNGNELGGGAIALLDSEAFIQFSTFDSNVVERSGGALYSFRSDLVMKDSEVINNDAVLSGGGFQLIDSSTTLDNVTFDSNESYSGGVITADQGSLTIIDSLFSRNDAIFQAGVLRLYGVLDVDIVDSEFTLNTAQFDGVIHAEMEGELNIETSLFDSNSAVSYGVLRALNTTATTNDIYITGSDFINNSGYNAAFYVDTVGDFFVDSSYFNNNLSTSYGVGYVDNPYFVLTNSTVENHTSNRALLIESDTYLIDNSTFDNNNGVINVNNNFSSGVVRDSFFINNSSSSIGAAILTNGALDVTNSQFTGNLATGDGVVYCNGVNDAVLLTVTGSTFNNNFASRGGGIHSTCDLTVLNSNFINNQATTGTVSDGGGAIRVSNLGGNPNTVNVNVDNSNFDSNEAKGTGGAIQIKNFGLNFNITNSDFLNNEALLFEGGAIGVQYADSGLISGSTFYGNSSIRGGAIAARNSALDVVDSELTGNIADYTTYGSQTTLSNASGGAIYSYNSNIGLDTIFAASNTIDSLSYVDSFGSFLHARGVSVDIVDSIILDHSATNGVGGIWLAEAHINLAGNLFAYNDITSNSGLEEYDSHIYGEDLYSLVFDQNTIAGNTGTGGSDYILHFDAAGAGPSVENNIIAFNDAADVVLSLLNYAFVQNNDVYDTSGTYSTGSLVGTPFASGGNITVDPQFIGNGAGDTDPSITLSPGTFDFSLQVGSAAAGMGAF